MSRRGPKARKRANRGAGGQPGVRNRGKPTKKAPAQPLSIDQMIEQADASLTQFRVEDALDQYNDAARLLRARGPQGTARDESLLMKVLEKLGEAKVSKGDRDGALNDFKEALSISEGKNSASPAASPATTAAGKEGDTAITQLESQSCLLFYIGQLSIGQEALHAFEEGVQRLESCLAKMDSLPAAMEDDEQSADEDAQQQHSSVTVLQQKLSNAYCTIAELYLTDLCFEENAESECEAILNKAMLIRDKDGEPMMDALQTMASLRLSQGSRQEEAIPCILKAYHKVKVGTEELASLVGLGPRRQQNGDDQSHDNEQQAVELKDVEAVNSLPEFEFRCQMAKILLECQALLTETDDHTTEENETKQEELVSAAVSVLGSLLAQNDEVIEIWFLTGCAFATMGSSEAETALFYFMRAMEMLNATMNSLKRDLLNSVDQEDKEDIQEQIDDTSTQIQEVQFKLDEINKHTAETEGGNSTMET